MLQMSVIAHESGRSSNHVVSIGAQAVTQWLLDAPLSRHTTPKRFQLFPDGPNRNYVLG